VSVAPATQSPAPSPWELVGIWDWSQQLLIQKKSSHPPVYIKQPQTRPWLPGLEGNFHIENIEWIEWGVFLII
jgi:hypothetical protein